MTATLSFKIRTIKNQIAACLREIARGVKSFIDRLVVLEGELDKLEKVKQMEKYIELSTYRSAGVNAYLVEEGKDHTSNMYGTPIDRENQERAYRSKSHTVKVRIDNLPDGIYRFVEAGGSTGKKAIKGWLKIMGGEIIEESDNLASLIVSNTSLPELEGSQKQIAWAIQIREKAIAKFRHLGKDVPSVLNQTTDAKWFIENRSSL